MKLSIIIPLYNKAPYIRKTLDSVISQTYTDWECIIVDDGSTDNSMNVVRERISELGSERVRVIQQQNAGVAAARNNGVKESRGEYICFLDADDRWEPTFLEEIEKLIAEYPDAGIYATNYIYYKPGKTHVALSLPRGYMNYPEAYLQCGSMPVTSITTCMPRKVFDEMGGFPVGIKLGEDFLLWAKTALHYKVAFCEKPLAYYNNDIPASLRATRNLHAPEHHMLFHLDPLLNEINRLPSTSNKSAWIRLIDKLRVQGLLEYWLSEEYHVVAEKELRKVDWSSQPRGMRRLYNTPIWLLRIKRNCMQLGSYIKQRYIKNM